MTTLHDNTKLGVWMFLGGEVIFFTTLILTFLLFRITDPADYPAFKQHLNIPLIGINTFILITSSYLVVRSLDSIHKDDQTGLQRNLLGVVILGALFLGGQAYEWITLFNEGLGVSGKFGTPFFTITGIHGLHVFTGLIWGVMLLFLARRRMFSSRENIPLEMFGLYWHFVDIVWIVLFTLFYLI